MLYFYTMNKTQNTQKNAKYYECKLCKFNSSNKYDYSKHLLTAKHKNTTDTTDIQPSLVPQHICSCGKTYNYRSSLFNHKKSCKLQKTNSNSQIEDVIHDDFPTMSDSSAVITLIKQNQEFKSLMVEQYTHLQESNQKNVELQQQLVDAVKNNTGSITNNNNNTTNNNQRFNINFFLNDTCKDAMSITDFLQNIDVQNDELEYIGHHGYVNGMTKMIMDRLKNMDVTKRPIHCTDIKRETMYIKEDGGWCKDTEELSKLRKILSRISMNNYRSVPNWRNAHPECEIVASRTYDFCYKMMQALLGDVEDEQIRLDNKIIKTMAKTLFVNKITA